MSIEAKAAETDIPRHVLKAYELLGNSACSSCWYAVEDLVEYLAEVSEAELSGSQIEREVDLRLYSRCPAGLLDLAGKNFCPWKKELA